MSTTYGHKPNEVPCINMRWVTTPYHNQVIKYVTTLALGSWPKQRFTKVRAKTGPGSHITCSRKCKRVWGNEPSHSQVNSHFGNWSHGGLLNVQRTVSCVKTHWIENFFISLKSSWNVNVWNGLAWPIWILETQVMAKRWAGSQIGNLTPDH